MFEKAQVALKATQVNLSPIFLTMAHQERHTPLIISLLAGGLAGTSVDLALFPIDTLKTRLQSPHGFLAAGGFSGVYRGVWAAAAGSAPGAALFFGTYEKMKPTISRMQRDFLGEASSPALTHMISACLGESAACLVRVPTEVLKSKMQTNARGTSTLSSTIKLVLAEKDGRAFASGLFGGLYRGYGITLMREVPFAFIQFPLYERLKIEWGKMQCKETSPLQAAACGSFAGGFAAAVTTPLDVVKTRLMLGADKLGVPYLGARDVVSRVVKEEGSFVLLSGIQPRVMWISIGGFVFFGAYESYRSMLLMSSVGL
jgi:solute carrier family 25 S-adenosylmethionine transporter 26